MGVIDPARRAQQFGENRYSETLRMLASSLCLPYFALHQAVWYPSTPLLLFKRVSRRTGNALNLPRNEPSLMLLF